MKRLLRVFALAFVVALSTVTANVHNYYNFSYISLDGTISGSGQLTTTIESTNPYGLSSVEEITGITNGYHTAPGHVHELITGVAPTNGSGGVNTSPDNLWYYDNLLWMSGVPSSVAGGGGPVPSYFDTWGLAFTVDGVPDSVNIWGPPVYVEGSGYNGAWISSAGVPITLTITATPEPGFYGALALGLSGLFVIARRRRKA